MYLHSCGRRQVHVYLLRSNTFVCHLLRHAGQDGVSVDGTFEDGLRGIVWGAAEIWDDTHSSLHGQRGTLNHPFRELMYGAVLKSLLGRNIDAQPHPQVISGILVQRGVLHPPSHHTLPSRPPSCESSRTLSSPCQDHLVTSTWCPSHDCNLDKGSQPSAE